MWVANLGQFDGATGVVDSGLSGGDSTSPPKDAAPDSGSDARLDVSIHDGASEEAAPDATADEPIVIQNLIQNPGFELGIFPWITFSVGDAPVIAQSPAYAHAGSYSGWVSNRTRTFEGTAQDIPLSNVVVGHTYSVSAWAMVAPSGWSPDAGVDSGPGDAGEEAAAPVLSEEIDLTAQIGCADGGAPATTFTRIAAVTKVGALTWTPITGYFTFYVASCDSISSLSVYLEGPTAPGVDLYVDDVSMMP